MNQRKNEQLTTPLVRAILQEVYDSVPKIMNTIAPLGWKQTAYHQEMINYRKMLYDDFRAINNDEAASYMLKRPTPEEEIPWSDDSDNNNDEAVLHPFNQPTTEQEVPWYDDIDFESYFTITFPPLYHDHLEIFYILAGLLLEITAHSTLYHDHDGYAYYFDDIQIEELVIDIAYHNKQIKKEEADIMFAVCPFPQLDDMDLLYCLETLFTILKKQDLYFNFWDHELLLITELQEAYHHIFYQDLHYLDKEQQLKQIQMDIILMLERYGGTTVNPLHLPSIIGLYNRRKVSPLVLAYLHVYDKFPLGYPYRIADYEP